MPGMASANKVCADALLVGRNFQALLFSGLDAFQQPRHVPAKLPQGLL